MSKTTIREILIKKGFDIPSSSMNWQYQYHNTFFFRQHMASSLKELDMMRDEVLDEIFDDKEAHPTIRFFEAKNPHMELFISFNDKASIKMIITIEYLSKQGDLEMDELFPLTEKTC